MRDEILMRQALDALQCFAENNLLVADVVAALKLRLGKEADGVGIDDPLLGEAIQYIYRTGNTSYEALQRELKCGYGRIGKMLDALEAGGLITAIGPDGKRTILRPALRVANG